jgi:1,4-dihydroxy-6-naphthoate synthase
MKLVISPCPNDVWVFAGWMLGKVAGPAVEVEFLDVQAANELLMAGGGDADVIKVSYGVWHALGASWHPLRSGGALGRGCGPLLLRNAAGGEAKGPILVPGLHTTANLLLDVYLDGEVVTKEFLPFDALYARLCAEPGSRGVVIHESRFTYVRDGLTLVQDLGEHWERVTGAPIPLGLIVHRDGLDTAEIDATIRRSIAWADAHPAEALELCATHAQELEPDVMKAHIGLYVNSFTVDIGAEGEAAIAALSSKLHTRPGHTKI